MLLCIEVLKWLITGKFGGDRCFFLILTQHRSRLRRKKFHLFGCRINSLWNALSKIFGVKAAVWIQERNGEKQARDEVENPKNATFMSVWEQLHSNSDVRSGNITQTHNSTEKRGSLWLNLNWRWQLTDSSLNSLNWCLFSCFLSSKWWREAQTTSSASSLPTSQKRADSLPQLFFFFFQFQHRSCCWVLFPPLFTSSRLPLNETSGWILTKLEGRAAKDDKLQVF